MRRREDWIKLAAYAILAALVATFGVMITQLFGWKTSVAILGAGFVAGGSYWWWCKRVVERTKKEEKKKNAPQAEYNHDLTREERRELSKEMRELEEQLKKQSKRKPP